ncbi:MAG: acetate--CoA ligase [Acidobacteriota bacterium]|nr:MAG: acetate--CoA ligase [Acidobacteriota bacterium]
MEETKKGRIEALLHEDRRFAPAESFTANANWKDPSIYEKASSDIFAFWEEMAQQIDWFKPWDKVFEGESPNFKWFSGAKTNVCYNCVDRHLTTWRKNKAAIIWEGEPRHSRRVLTYQDLYREVNRCAAAMKRLGVQKGDRVALYMGMIPELAISMLACARIGAPHTVVFGGFSPDALRDRINDCGAKMLITADGAWRRGNRVPLKENADEALKGCPTIDKVIVVNHCVDARDVEMEGYRDVWWHREMDRSGNTVVKPEELDAEHPLYILYTSGTTGKPKGLLHTTGGYLVGVHTTTKYVFDLKDNDTYWCAADIGWVTGHSYIVYGPLSNGATGVMYEGAPNHPHRGRFWQIIERNQVNILYTAPTAIRAFMAWGKEFPEQYDLSSLRLMGTVGEPINPEAWMWYREFIGGNKTPIVDTWWQTETGMTLITPLPGLVETKPGSATFPFPGIEADIVDESGETVPFGGGGYLVLKNPWPAMARTIWGDPERWYDQYWSRFPGMYFTGDSAKRDEDGYYWILGRVDDVLNVAGHRIGTMEVESALVSHPAVAEAAVIGISHAIKGQAIAAFTTLVSGIEGDKKLIEQLRQHVAEKIGPIARPEKLFLTHELPKTRSGKIMRRLLRDIAEGQIMSDTTTLADPGVLEQIKEQYEESGN